MRFVLALLFGLIACKVFAVSELEQQLADLERMKNETPSALIDLQSDPRDPVLSNWHAYYKSYGLFIVGRKAEALAILQQLMLLDDPKLLLYVKGLLLNIYAHDGDSNQGLPLAYDIANALASLQNKTDLQYAIAVLALFYERLDQPEYVGHYASQLLEIADPGKYRCTAYNLRLEYNIALAENFDRQEFESIRALQGLPCENHKLFYLIHTLRIARLLLIDGQPEAALAEVEKLKPYFLDATYIGLTKGYYSLLSSIYLSLDKDEFAETAALKSLEITTLDSEITAVEATKNLAAIYEQRGDSDESLRYYKRFATGNARYLDELAVRQASFITYQKEMQARALEIERLHDQNSLLRLNDDLNKSRQEKQLIVILVLIQLLLGVVAYGFRSRKLQAHFKQLSQRDALTGVYNRGYFIQRAEQLLSAAQASQKPISLLLFDLDHFKKINDRYGHGTGDAALLAVTQVCQAICSDNDLFARIGGEEFAVLLPDRDRHEAGPLATKQCEAIARIDTSATGFEFNLTASFGLADTQLSGYSLDTLLAHADGAMFTAKSAGRNQVVLFEPDNPQMDLSPPRQTVTP